MYKLLIPVLLLSLLFSCKENKLKNKHDRYVKVYENALQLGDLNVAINACYEIIANDSSQINYYDSLVYLYLNTPNQGATYLTARRCLNYHPDNAKMNEVAANYAKELGMLDTAILLYKKTYLLTHRLKNLYDVAQLQYNMGNDAAAEETADIIIKSADSEKENVIIAVDKETSQQIPAKAAALNIKGVIFIQLGLKDKALGYFEEALRLAPDFKLAKQNRDDIISGKIKFIK